MRGIDARISWDENRQWLDLVARSGTPLFVSIAPDALGSEQRGAIHQAFELASKSQPVAQPVDWLTNHQPEHWLAQGKQLSYDWFA